MKASSNSVLLSRSQRRAILDLFPQFADRLQPDADGQRKVQFTVSELQAVLWCAGEAIPVAASGSIRNALGRVVAIFQKAIRDAHGIGAIPSSRRLYQFRITLAEISPAIWRRIQVKDCTIDKLHEHIQTAMGWTNSHLHRFEIAGIIHGDPELICEDPEGFVGVNSRVTRLSEIVPQSGARMKFTYVYDYGDCWTHEVVFEGCLTQDQGVHYPLCLEGERACPPEDAGGVMGYENLLEVLGDPEHEEHRDLKGWAGEDYDPESFDSKMATRRMKRGLPDWRKLEQRRLEQSSQ